MAGHNVSPVREAIVCLCLFGIVLQFISIIGTEWAVPPEAGTGEGSDSFEGVGLWKFCFRQEDIPGSGKFHYVCQNLVGGSEVPGWMSGVQAVTLLAIIFYAFAFLAIIIFTCCGSQRDDKRLIVAFIVLQTVAGIFNLIGVVLFSEKLHATFRQYFGLLQLAWCFISNCVSDGLASLTVILAVVEFFRSKSTVPMQRFTNEMDTQSSGTNPPSYDTQNQSVHTPETPTGGYQSTTTAQIINNNSDSTA